MIRRPKSSSKLKRGRVVEMRGYDYYEWAFSVWSPPDAEGESCS